MRGNLKTAAFIMYFKSSSLFFFPSEETVWRRQIIQLHFQESTFRFSFHSTVTWQMCNVLNRLRFEGDTEAKLGASVGCRGDDGCTTPTVTAQRACWVNMDSPESGTTGNDTTEGKKHQLGCKNHTHTHIWMITHREVRGEGCFSCQHLSLPPSPFLTSIYICPSELLSLYRSYSILPYSAKTGPQSTTLSQLCTHSCTYTHTHMLARRESQC